MATIHLLVTSDVLTDQRVQRTAATLSAAGHRTVVVGRRTAITPAKIKKEYCVHLLSPLFSKGMFFYLSYNILAFCYLSFKKTNIIYANDLDTLLAARALSFFKRVPLIYDSHELFTEVPELVKRPIKKGIWRFLEKWLIKGTDAAITVSASVAIELNRRYGVPFEVIRNLPLKKSNYSKEVSPTDEKVVFYQGALNIGRGLEKLIMAMQYLPQVKLRIAGTGDIDNKLAELSKFLQLETQVKFLGRVEPDALHSETLKATIGVSLEEDISLNYRYALPNKLFDYIQAGLPVLTSNLPEMEKIVNTYNVGQTINSNCTASELAKKINVMLNNSSQMELWRENSIALANVLNWEEEKHKLVKLVTNVLNSNA